MHDDEGSVFYEQKEQYDCGKALKGRFANAFLKRRE